MLLGAFTHVVVVRPSFAVLGIVLAALYILLMYQRTMTGPTAPEVAGHAATSTSREVAALAPLLVLIVVLGFFPKPLTSIINPAVDRHPAAGRRRATRRPPCPRRPARTETAK